MRIGDDFKPFFRPRYLYTLEAHVTEPRPCWHENPVLALARDIQAMDLSEHITVAGKLVRKRWSKHTGTRYVVCWADGRYIKAYRSVLDASKRVYEETE